ncbi:MAG TPA: PPK2 family polyphosphate kinase [Pirellulales bacterium]|jgi:PPK2 family polyphosphate:nucleotide phosphotransferase|nr:PPK2 family polyphosphate kinase [Pirellulales bacterium]
MSQPLKVKPGAKVQLKDFDPDFHDGIEKQAALEEAAKNADALDELAYRLYAEHRRALLIVLQGMDTSGKDGTIRHVMSRVSPQTCKVVSFKQPNSEELEHDFLWRVHRAVPPKGQIGIFNRSHYEDVLVVRVHHLVEKSVWKSRYEKINLFEKFLAQEGTTILKFFLHISRDEQRERLLKRIEDPHKLWKISEADVAERKYWDDYQRAYEDAIAECGADHASWYIVPANHKWYRNLVVGRVVHETLKQMDPKFPAAAKDLTKLVIE